MAAICAKLGLLRLGQQQAGKWEVHMTGQGRERENVWYWAEKYDERYREFHELINEQLGGSLDRQALRDMYAADRRVQEARTEFIRALDHWARLTEQGTGSQPLPRVGPTYG